MSSEKHFRDIIRAFLKFHQIRSETDFNKDKNPLKPNALALRAFGSGKNLDFVRKALNDYESYFYKIRDGRFYAYKPNYKKILNDYPELFNGFLKVAVDNKSNFHQIIQAIEDEIDATKDFARQNPIFALYSEKLHWAIKGKFFYRLTLIEQSDMEINLHENTPIRISWSYSNDNLLEGTLVIFDPINESIIIELNRELNQFEKENRCRVFAGTVDLLESLKNQISELKAEHHFSHQIISKDLKFKELQKTYITNTSNLDESQNTAVKHALNNNITFIWGPPGTGKTHTLARIIVELLTNHERVLSTSISNVAIDQLALKVVADLIKSQNLPILDGGKLIRFGFPKLDLIRSETRLFPQKSELDSLIKSLNQTREQAQKSISSDRKAELLAKCKHIEKQIKEITRKSIGNAQCVFTTSTQCQLESAFSQTTWDTLVIDEGSMVSIAHLVALAMHAKKRIIIAGDFRQLGPIALAQTKYAKAWLKSDSFSLLNISKENISHPSLKMLMLQRRMHPTIAKSISIAFYKGQLASIYKSNLTPSIKLEPLSDEPIVWYKCSDEAEQKGSTRFNSSSALKIVSIINLILSQSIEVSISVITPYRGQVSEVKKAIGQSKELLDKYKKQIKIGTVHAFQGDESDIVIFDTVDSQSLAVGKLFHGESGDRLVNVALSRAKEKLIIIGDLNLFVNGNGSNNTERFAKLFQDHILNKTNCHIEK